MKDMYPITLLAIVTAAAGLSCSQHTAGRSATGQVARPDAQAEAAPAFEVRQPGDEAAVQFGPIALPDASEATLVPAHWFLSIAPGSELGKDAMDACALGDLGGVSLTLAAIEVGFDRIAVAGTVVGELERGRAPDAGWGELIEGALQGALETLGDANHRAAQRGCRPWATFCPLPPADITPLARARAEARARFHPPLLLVIDAGVPMETVVRVEQAAKAARFRIDAVWVDALDPAPFALSESPSTPGPVLWSGASAQGAQWARQEASAHADLGGDPPSSGWGETPPEAVDVATQALVITHPTTTAGSALAQWNEVAGLGIQCVDLRADPDAGVSQSPRGPAVRKTLRWDDSIGAISLAEIKVIGPSSEARYQRLLTGAQCPPYTRTSQAPSASQAEAEAKTLIRDATGRPASGSDSQRVARDLLAIRQQHPEVADTVAATPGDKRSDRRDLSLAKDGDDHLYIFLQGRGDCSRGCPHHDLLLFGTDAGGKVEALGCSDDQRVGYLSRHPQLENAIADLGREGFEYRPPELARHALCLELCEAPAYHSCLRDSAEAAEGRAQFEVVMEFDVAPDGNVIQARAEDQSLEGSAVERCMATALGDYSIQPFSGDEPRTVRFGWNLVKGRRIVCPSCRRGERSRPYPAIELVELVSEVEVDLQAQLTEGRLGLCLGEAPDVEQFDVSWTLQPHGASTGVRVSGIERAEVRSCITNEVRSWWQPGEQETPVSVQATFRPADRPHDLGCRK